MSQLGRNHLAVFTRNHRHHLDEAVALSAANREREVTFRASTRWASAAKGVMIEPIPIYIASVGGRGTVDYVGELCDVQISPHRGDPKTERLLKLATQSTQHEGLWEKSDKDVETLYVIRDCRNVPRPFPLSTLIKASDGEPLSDDYKYSYALVVPVDSAVTTL